MALFLGTSLGPLIGGYIADAFGFRASCYTAAGMMAMGALIVTAVVHENFTRPETGQRRAGLMGENRYLIKIALVPVLLVVIFMIQFGQVIVSPILTLFIDELSGRADSATVAGIVLGATGFMSALSAITLGRVSDRIGHSLILSICLAGAALTYFPQAFVREVWELMALRMLLGVFLGGLMPSANALVASIVPHERRGSAFGLTSTAAALASSIGPLTAAAIVTLSGLRAVFLATGGLFVLACLWVTIGFRRDPKAVANAQSHTPESTSSPKPV